jgi:hypothetical protein
MTNSPGTAATIEVNTPGVPISKIKSMNDQHSVIQSILDESNEDFVGLWVLVREGCDLRNPKSVREWVTRNTIRETNISKASKRRRDNVEKAAAKGTFRTGLYHVRSDCFTV